MGIRKRSRFPLPSRSDGRGKRRFAPVLEAMDSKLLLSTSQYLLNNSGQLYRQADSDKTLVATDVKSFAVGNSGHNVYWLTTTGGLWESKGGGAMQWLDGWVQSFAPADNAAGFVDLTINGVLQEGYGSTPLASGVQSFAVGNSGHNVYWLTTTGGLWESVGGATRWLNGWVQSFAPADNAAGFVDLTINGVLQEGYGSTPLASGVQSFAVGNSGHNVYWLTTTGGLWESVGGATRWLNGWVQSFAPADNAAGFVDLTINGALQEGYGSTPLATGVQSFAVSNGGQSVYWLTTTGGLWESVRGATRWLDGWVQSFAPADNAAGFVDLTINGVLQEGYGSTPLATGVQSFAVSNGGQSVYWLNTNGNLYGAVNGTTQLLDGGVGSLPRWPPAVWSSSYSSPTAAWPRACPTTTWACW